MDESSSSPRPTDSPDHALEDHRGILRVSPRPDHEGVEVEFDPAVLSEVEVRELLHEHAPQLVPAPLRKAAFRLEGRASEACAQKLERKVTGIPGVRRATATYLGKVLAVTFDSAVEPEARIEQDLRDTGADIAPLIPHAAAKRTLWQRIRGGELNEELSCATGFACLMSALLVERQLGHGIAVNALYLGAYVFAGQEGVRSAIASLRGKVLDVDVLMVLAALGAAAIGAPFEGALLLFLFSLSNVLQSHAMERTRKAIESLLTLRPREALVRRDGATVSVPIEDIGIGETVVVKPGGQIPADGLLTEGETSIDESSLTGESMPVSKSPGSPVFAGTINQSGGIELQVTKRAEDSTLARMVQLVAEAQAEKSATQRFMETAEQSYAIGVIVLTVLVFAAPVLMHGEPFAESFYRAMTVMVVASPCALVISTPATVLSAIGGAARKGILIKGGSHLERAAAIDIVAVDKTGTLTVGKPELVEIVTAAGRHPLDLPLGDEARRVLRACAALESRSEHPLAHAIVRAAATAGIALPEATGFQSTAGKGAEATVDGVRHLVGSERLFEELGAKAPPALGEAARELQDLGKSCVWLGVRREDGVHAFAVFALADTLRPAARHLAADLKRLGVRRLVMLTGDHERVARAIAREAGVDDVRSQLLPADKLEIIRQLKLEGTVMMVGDGVNDAPALAMSDVGVAMGAAGTDVAMETADVVLMGDRIENVPLLLAHARRARRVLMQNLGFATAVIGVLVVAALGLELPLPLGVVGHEGSTVLVCLNGLRLLFIARH